MLSKQCINYGASQLPVLLFFTLSLALRCSVTLTLCLTLWSPFCILAWSTNLYCPEELILDVAASKLLLHCGSCGCIQHLQPHLRWGKL